MSHDLQKQNKEKNQTCAINGRLSPQKWCFFFFFADGRSQQQFPPLFCSYCGLESAQLRTGRSTIHKFQATAFSSIIILIYKVHALHFLIQPPKGSSPFRHSFRLHVFTPPTFPRGQQRSLRSRHGCCLSAPPEVSPISLLRHLLDRPHLHISDLMAQKGRWIKEKAQVMP